MDLRNALIAELKNEGEATKKLIACLPEDDWQYKPHPKSMTLHNLSNHVVGLIDWMRLILQKDTLDLANFQPTAVAQNTKELISLCDSFIRDAQLAFENIDQDELNKIWTLQMGENIIMQLPKADAIRYVVNNHLYHHRGQLTVYLRMLDIKIPGLYGPSADEQ